MDFDLLGFAAHMSALAAHHGHPSHEAMEKAANLVAEEAKAEIGHYQDAVGGFAAWEQLAGVTQKKRADAGFTPNDPLLVTGDLQKSIESTVADNKGYVGSGLDEAVWQEMGTERIPPRSFLGGAAARKGHEVARLLGRDVVSSIAGRKIT